MWTNRIWNTFCCPNNSRKISFRLSENVSWFFSVHFLEKKEDQIHVFKIIILSRTKLIKRSDNASVLSGKRTIMCEKYFADVLGIKLLMRDYSEVQCGKSVCDRLSGSAKLRMRAFMNAGNDVMTAIDIKKGTFKNYLIES